MTLGIPLESLPSERRVALVPLSISALLKKGFNAALVSPSAGANANFPDAAYQYAGATIDPNPFSADIVLKVRPPTLAEIEMLKEGSTLISFLYPAQNKDIVQKLRERGVTSFAMDQIPRISRAQVFDALSSMANTAGYRAILEAGNEFGRYLTGQTTAAGKVPPGKVLVRFFPSLESFFADCIGYWRRCRRSFCDHYCSTSWGYR
jgi:NAD(P) transhydrogenase